MEDFTKSEFEYWMYNGGTTSKDSGYINHAIAVLEYWLDEKLPNNGIGNLFRFEDSESYYKELNRIKNLPEFYDVNKSDQNGRPKAALNKYKEPKRVKIEKDNNETDINQTNLSNKKDDKKKVDPKKGQAKNEPVVLDDTNSIEVNKINIFKCAPVVFGLNNVKIV